MNQQSWNIEYVNFFNFLGLIIDLHLTWENHTIHMSNRCLIYPAYVI